MRKRIYEIIEVARPGDRASVVYDGVMLALILISLIPLAFKENTPLFEAAELFTVAVFALDYVLRWFTADLKQQRGVWSFLLYPFTPWAVVDLVSILPALRLANGSFKLLRSLRMMRALRVLRVFKAMRYSRSLVIIAGVIRHSRHALTVVAFLASGYILVSALVIFNVEPESFKTFFDAVYWATVSLTTVGYGDLYPVTTIGRSVAMISSLFGIAVVALPAGIITAGYMEALQNERAGGENDAAQPERAPSQKRKKASAQ